VPGARASTILLVALLSGACGETVQLGQTQADLDADNGVSLNGISPNGISPNGISPNGISPNGISPNGISPNGVSPNGASGTLARVSYDGATLNGIAITGLHLYGSNLTGVRTSDNHVVTGGDLNNLILNGALEDGTPVRLHVDTSRRAADDLYFYKFSYLASSGSWTNLCYDSAGKTVEGLPFAGVWSYQAGVSGGGAWTNDPNNFTIGCRYAGLAKCAEAGYYPWRSLLGTSLRPYHQACTRMLRADYCGDGTPWTVNGRMTNLWDGLNVQVSTESWTFEAEWNAAGATCVSSQRVLTYVGGVLKLPPCWQAKQTTPCGSPSDFATGTLLMDQYQTQDLNYQ
jgi:hypothetical protein